MGEFIKKSKARQKLRVVGGRVIDPHFEKTYPALFDYFCSDRWDDKTPRLTTTLWLFAEDGRIKACVSDRDTQESAFVTADTLLGLLEAIEEGLAQDGLSWRKKSASGALQRPSKSSGQKGSKRV